MYCSVVGFNASSDSEPNFLMDFFAGNCQKNPSPGDFFFQSFLSGYTDNKSKVGLIASTGRPGEAVEVLEVTLIRRSWV